MYGPLGVCGPQVLQYEYIIEIHRLPPSFILGRGFIRQICQENDLVLIYLLSGTITANCKNWNQENKRTPGNSLASQIRESTLKSEMWFFLFFFWLNVGPFKADHTFPGEQEKKGISIFKKEFFVFFFKIHVNRFSIDWLFCILEFYTLQSCLLRRSLFWFFT